MENYLPVYVGNRVQYIFANGKEYPVKLLTQVSELLSGRPCSSVSIDENGDFYVKESEDSWSKQEVELALAALEDSLLCDMWYVPILNKEGDRRLFISSKFGDSYRILVDTQSMERVVIKDQRIAACIHDLSRHRHPNHFLEDIFQAVCSKSVAEGHFLDMIIVNRGEPDEYVAMSPLLTRWYMNNPYINAEDFDEIEAALNGQPSNDFCVSKGNLYCAHITYWVPMSSAYTKKLFKRIRSLYKLRSSYKAVNDEVTGEPMFYVSSDFRHLVKASTLEHIVVKNVCILNQLKEVLLRGEVSLHEFCDLWRSASVMCYEKRE